MRVAYEGGFSAPEALDAPEEGGDPGPPPAPTWPTQDGEYPVQGYGEAAQDEYGQVRYDGSYEAPPEGYGQAVGTDGYYDAGAYQQAQALQAEPWFRQVEQQPEAEQHESWFAPEGHYEQPVEPVVPAPEPAKARTGRTDKSKRKTYTRRGVLAGAAAGGAAVAAARLLILDKPAVLANFGYAAVDLSDHRGRLHNTVLDAPQPQSTTVTQVVKGPAGFPVIAEPLKISQLLRRTAFGGTDALAAQANKQGFAKTVDQLLATAPAQPPAFKGGETLGMGNINLNDLQDWWLTHMITTPTPFQERMTLFMASIFTSDYQKVGLDKPFLIWQNRTWRDMALTDLRTILKRVSVDPAMLVYLDGNGSNGRGTPNQNYARELMELFSIGLVYKETDVTEGAKALSGWRVPQTKDNTQLGVFDPNRHFTGAVSFLGRTQPMDVDGVIDAILAHPAAAPFITTKFVTEFVTATPDQAYINRLAANFRKSGYQIKTLMRDILMSPEFGAQSNFRALVKSPMELMVGAARLTGANPATVVPIIRNYSRTLGHSPFDPPDVGGWPRNIAWLSPIALMNRVNFVTDFVNALKGVAAPQASVQRYLDGIMSPGTSQTLTQATTDAARWWSLLASPDAQLA